MTLKAPFPYFGGKSKVAARECSPNWFVSEIVVDGGEIYLGECLEWRGVNNSTHGFCQETPDVSVKALINRLSLSKYQVIDKDQNVVRIIDFPLLSVDE